MIIKTFLWQTLFGLTSQFNQHNNSSDEQVNMRRLSINQLTDNYKLRLSYDIITNYPPAKPCIKRYLFSNVQGKGLYGIKGEDWSYAAALPLQKFRGASENTVWGRSKAMY